MSRGGLYIRDGPFATFLAPFQSAVETLISRFRGVPLDYSEQIVNTYRFGSNADVNEIRGKDDGFGPEKRMAAQARRGMSLSGGAAAAAACRRQRDFGFPHQIRRKIRHVCRGRLRRLRALLFRRSARCRDFPLALRAEGGALQARGVMSSVLAGLDPPCPHPEAHAE